jgi:hypothetical protein
VQENKTFLTFMKFKKKYNAQSGIRHGIRHDAIEKLSIFDTDCLVAWVMDYFRADSYRCRENKYIID